MHKTLRVPKEGWRVYVGDALASLKTMPDQCIHTCVTSPPYFGLRDYGVDGQMGLEQTPAEYVANMVELFREVRRVLRDDGTLWLNIGLQELKHFLLLVLYFLSHTLFPFNGSATN